MRRRLIVLLTFFLAFQVSAEAQEKWELKVNSGTNYAIPTGIFSNSNADMPYRNNKTWYPGFTLGTSMSYTILPWMAFESGLNFERIRTGYQIYRSQTGTSPGTGYGGGNSDPTYLAKYHYSKNYLNVPLLIALKTSSNFGFFGGIGYRFALKKEIGSKNELDWNELIYTGGFFVNFGKVSTRFSYTEGGSKKDWGEFSKSRTVSLTVGYTLWKK